MYRLIIPGISLPRLYVVDSMADAVLCRRKGIPYIKWHGDQRELIAIILLPTLQRMFPGINWIDVLKIKHRADSIKVIDGGTDGITYNGSDEPAKLLEYVGADDIHVDIEQLQQLGMLPTFMAEITDAIYKNLEDYIFWEGYNKKHDDCSGIYTPTPEGKNLIILDVSASIPWSVADTMLALIDTLRTQANADLIITGGKSYYWKQGEELPEPQELRRKIPRSNEFDMFMGILENELNGKSYDNVVVFGDLDSPSYWNSYNTRIRKITFSCHEVWGYNTYYNKVPGYGRWILDTCQPNVHINTNWIEEIE